MANSKIRFHPYAADEVERARNWYAERSTLAAHAFLIELDHAIEQVSQTPLRWPQYLAGTRRYTFPHFPFSLIFRFDGNRLTIVAVSHHRRKPGYWAARGPA